MMSAVKKSEIAAAATIAMLMDNSIVIRRAATFSAASLKIGHPPIRTPSYADQADARERFPQVEPHRGRR